jgi:hypothetical protein
MTAGQREVLQALADEAVLSVHRHPDKGDVLRVQLYDYTGEPKAFVLIATFEALEWHGWVAAHAETIRHPAVGERPEYVVQTYEITASGLDALHEEWLR